MRYYRSGREGNRRLYVRNGDTAYDLTGVKPSVTHFSDLCVAADVTGQSIDSVASRLVESAETVPLEELREFGKPVVPDEVMAAGVTYRISEQARQSESGKPEVYIDVYEGERPELFFKATPNRTVGPDEAVGIRSDSTWDVPEPELGVVLYNGDIVGYTIGNDMSSRSIEGENPLYLPQAKMYDRCCSIGPCVASTDEIADPHDLEIAMQIERDGETLFDDTTSTSKMVRSCEELVSYYVRHNDPADVTVLLTGTSLVPDDDFTLLEGDRITIDIEDIGTLTNDVVSV